MRLKELKVGDSVENSSGQYKGKVISRDRELFIIDWGGTLTGQKYYYTNKEFFRLNHRIINKGYNHPLTTIFK